MDSEIDRWSGTEEDDVELAHLEPWEMQPIVSHIDRHIAALEEEVSELKREIESSKRIRSALSRLPKLNEWARFEVTLGTPVTDGEHRWATLEAGEGSLRFSVGAHYYAPGVGGDTESRTVCACWDGGSSGWLNEWVEEWRSIASVEHVLTVSTDP